jgi:hypothetical protein
MTRIIKQPRERRDGACVSRYGDPAVSKPDGDRAASKQTGDSHVVASDSTPGARVNYMELILDSWIDE